MEFFENDIRSNLVFFWKSSEVLRKDEKRQNDLISSELPIFQQKRAPELELVYSHTLSQLRFDRRNSTIEADLERCGKRHAVTSFLHFFSYSGSKIFLFPG